MLDRSQTGAPAVALICVLMTMATTIGGVHAAGERVADQRIKRTRISAAYSALIAGLVVLVLLLVFILENTRQAKVTFFGASGHLPLGVGLLLAAVAGAVIVAIALWVVGRRTAGPIGGFVAALFFVALEDLCGHDNLRAALRDIIHDRAGSDTGYEELRAATESASGKDLAEMFRTWLVQPGIPGDFRARYSIASEAHALN